MSSTQRPDTLVRDQRPSSPISLATHRRSIHRVIFAISECLLLGKNGISNATNWVQN